MSSESNDFSQHSEDEIQQTSELATQAPTESTPTPTKSVAKSGKKKPPTVEKPRSKSSRTLPESLIEYQDQAKPEGAETRKQYIDSLNHTTGVKMLGLLRKGRWFRNKKNSDREFRALRFHKSFVPAYGYLVNQAMFDGLVGAQMVQIKEIFEKSGWLPKLHQAKKNGKMGNHLRWFSIGKSPRTSAAKLPRTIRGDQIIAGCGKVSGISKAQINRTGVSIHSRLSGPSFNNPTKSSFIKRKDEKEKSKKTK